MIWWPYSGDTVASLDALTLQMGRKMNKSKFKENFLLYITGMDKAS